MSNMYAVIMAGGRGERFWPMSTSQHPKQVIRLVGDRPMLGLAVDYVKTLIPPERVLVITSADLVDVICQAVPELPPANIIGEPFGRDTAAVCALATALVKARDPQATICILTADHIISDLELFRTTLREAAELAAQKDVLITIGIQPTFPSTGFGYIEAAEPIATGGHIEFFKTKRFVEKPNIETARGYVAAGKYFWNAGMFVWSVESFTKALATHRPVLHEMLHRLLPHCGAATFAGKLREEYSQLERISVDYAIMEKAGNIIMANGLFRWDDVGSWTALANHFPADTAGNVCVGTCEQIDSSGNIVVSKGHLTALIGIKDTVVVQVEGVTLICARDRVQSVKQMVQQLGTREALKHLL